MLMHVTYVCDTYIDACMLASMYVWDMYVDACYVYIRYVYRWMYVGMQCIYMICML